MFPALLEICQKWQKCFPRVWSVFVYPLFLHSSSLRLCIFWDEDLRCWSYVYFTQIANNYPPFLLSFYLLPVLAKCLHSPWWSDWPGLLLVYTMYWQSSKYLYRLYNIPCWRILYKNSNLSLWINQWNYFRKYLYTTYLLVCFWRSETINILTNQW